MIAGRRFDWAVLGRDNTVGPSVGSATGLIPSSATGLPWQRAMEVSNLYNRLRRVAHVPLLGHRHFPCSDYGVISSSSHGVGWVASVHAHSNRTKAAACVNEEGKLSEHTADGMVHLYVDGDEYTGVQPLWDWQQLPGLTAVHDPAALAKSSCAYQEQLSSDSSLMHTTGGASDGESGLVALELSSRGLFARKSVHLLERGFAQRISSVACAGPSAAPVPSKLARFERDL